MPGSAVVSEFSVRTIQGPAKADWPQDLAVEIKSICSMFLPRSCSKVILLSTLDAMDILQKKKAERCSASWVLRFWFTMV